MHKEHERLLTALAAVRERTDFVPQVGVVLGSGLGAFAEKIEKVAEIAYGDIPGFPVSTAPGHAGRFVFGYVEETPVAVMQGRVHMYEGYSVQDVVLPARLLKLMGARIFFITNASGGIHSDLDAGDLMLLTDHLDLFVPNPLRGENIAELGVRFPDMSEVYDKALRDRIRAAAAKNGVELKEGVYVQCPGPSYETPADIRMLGLLGADAVGMSTVVEATAARHCGLRVCAVSCVANKAAGISPTPLSGEEVIEAANAAAPRFQALLWDSIAAMKEERE
ncbi:MAG: purine-nucleoside phosphorylase [Oscillospiraceae bacterium]|nr:purine-nucleoside phosphorylase [Oscillospiraceae bacterium]